MGLFSGIKKAFKKVFKGIKKVFKKVGKFVGKILSSKWAKGLMLAAAVFTGGMAIAAGVQGFAGSTATSFLGKFVAGAKEFISVIASPIKSAKNLAGGNPLTEGLAQQAGNAVTGAAANTAEGLVEGAAATGAEALGTQTAGVAGAATEAAAGGAGAAAKKGILGHAKDLIMSPGGGKVLGGILQGYGAGAAEEERLKREDQYRGAFSDEQFNSINSAVGDVALPQGYLARAQRTTQDLERNYQSPTQPGNPADVYGSYVRPQAPAQPGG